MYPSLSQTIPSSAPLGQKSPYPKNYDRALLQPIARAAQREAMNLPRHISFFGFDVWNAYELFWLNGDGKPVRAYASLVVDANSIFLCESKSVKLYLNSLNHERFTSIDEVANLIKTDLSQICVHAVEVLMSPMHLAKFDSETVTSFRCIDDINIPISAYTRCPELLVADKTIRTNERLVSHLFKSHCLCTGQPDLGSIFIEYTGPKIKDSSLLAYLVSYRDHVGFSENCIEQIFCDIWEFLAPEKLVVFGRFTRRGGIDINPYRASYPIPFHNARLIYQ